jgi:plastocyanin
MSASMPASTAAPSAGAGSMAGAPVLEIKDFAYNSVTVKAGGMVMVKNDDAESHTVTSRQAGAFDDMATASSTTMFNAPSTPGQYAFYCKYHGNMKGVLSVT